MPSSRRSSVGDIEGRSQSKQASTSTPPPTAKQTDGRKTTPSEGTPPPSSSKTDAAFAGPYLLCKTLGEGSYGKVKLGKHMRTGELVAVKMLKKSMVTKSEKALLRVRREVAILRVIKHPCVTRMVDLVQTSEYLFIILEYVEGGDLLKCLRSHGVGGIPAPKAFRFFHQIVSGLEYCHSCCICHRDIKPENILLDSHGNAKLADFGMANLGEVEGKMMETSCGSPHYAAPEVIRGKMYDGTRSDVWSLGVLLYGLFAGKLPFNDPNIPKLLDKVIAAEYILPSHFSDDLKDLIQRLLVVDPDERMTVLQIKSHPFWANSCQQFDLPLNGCHAPTGEEDILGTTDDQLLEGPPGVSNENHSAEERDPPQQPQLLKGERVTGGDPPDQSSTPSSPPEVKKKRKRYESTSTASPNHAPTATPENSTNEDGSPKHMARSTSRVVVANPPPSTQKSSNGTNSQRPSSGHTNGASTVKFVHTQHNLFESPKVSLTTGNFQPLLLLDPTTLTSPQDMGVVIRDLQTFTLSLERESNDLKEAAQALQQEQKEATHNPKMHMETLAVEKMQEPVRGELDREILQFILDTQEINRTLLVQCIRQSEPSMEKAFYNMLVHTKSVNGTIPQEVTGILGMLEGGNRESGKKGALRGHRQASAPELHAKPQTDSNAGAKAPREPHQNGRTLFQKVFKKNKDGATDVKFLTTKSKQQSEPSLSRN